MKLIIISIILALFASLSFPHVAKSVQPPIQYKTEMAIVTGYSSTPNQTDDTPFITASGTHVHPGTLACPRSIPFGTHVLINGNQYTCEDRLALRFDSRFDIWFPTTAQAIEWGMQTIPIQIELSPTYILQ